MLDCCPAGYGKLFDTREARRNARSYRKKGLGGTARRMVDFLAGEIGESSVLEVGGGVGAIQVELLRAGASRAVNVELSPEYEAEAITLMEEAGFSGRAERRIGDFVLECDGLEPAGVVLMDRVVCCYPDMEALVAATGGHARRYLAMSFPRDTWWIRLLTRVENRWYRLRGIEFRSYVHSPSAILAVAGTLGFRPVLEHEGVMWQVVVLERSS